MTDTVRDSWGQDTGPTVDVPGEADGDRETTSTFALFEGDQGTLGLEQRKALIALLKNRFISWRTHPKEYAAISANPRAIWMRLNDVFLDLVLDTERQVAYKRQVAPEGNGSFPTLLYDRAWGREETMLLMYLRDRHRAQTAAGAERVYADRADMYEWAEQHRPPSATDIAGDRKRVQNAISTIARSGLLIGSSDGDRFEISHAIEVLLPVTKLRELLTWFQAQNGTMPDTGAPDTEPDEVEAERQDGLEAACLNGFIMDGELSA